MIIAPLVLTAVSTSGCATSGTGDSTSVDLSTYTCGDFVRDNNAPKGSPEALRSGEVGNEILREANPPTGSFNENAAKVSFLIATTCLPNNSTNGGHPNPDYRFAPSIIRAMRNPPPLP